MHVLLPEAATLVIGKKIKMDLGYAKTKQESRYFSMMLGVGFVPSLIKKISPKFKRKWGRYLISVTILQKKIRYRSWLNIFGRIFKKCQTRQKEQVREV